MKSVLIQFIVMIGLSAPSLRAFAQSNQPSGCAIVNPTNPLITIVEYADFNCTFCARGANLMKQVLRDYPGKVKLVFRNMPLAAHPESLTAAKAFTAICLQSPELAFTFQSELFARQSNLKTKGEDYLYALAKKIGANVDQIKIDVNRAEVAKSIENDQLAAKSLGFIGTPSFLIGSESISGALPYAEIKKVIDRQLSL